ncbi:MAG: hypothetical protein M1820_007536 [Bogoriella megaspora]|nr:MAG: hypothetical protein M1820_007536 [Bogoriella megaspora]
MASSSVSMLCLLLEAPSSLPCLLKKSDNQGVLVHTPRKFSHLLFGLPYSSIDRRTRPKQVDIPPTTPALVESVRRPGESEDTSGGMPSALPPPPVSTVWEPMPALLELDCKSSKLSGSAPYSSHLARRIRPLALADCYASSMAKNV